MEKLKLKFKLTLQTAIGEMLLMCLTNKSMILPRTKIKNQLLVLKRKKNAQSLFNLGISLSSQSSSHLKLLLLMSRVYPVQSPLRANVGDVVGNISVNLKLILTLTVILMAIAVIIQTIHLVFILVPELLELMMAKPRAH